MPITNSVPLDNASAVPAAGNDLPSALPAASDHAASAPRTSSAGNPSANAYRRQGDSRNRQRLLNQRPTAGASTNAAAAPATGEPAATSFAEAAPPAAEHPAALANPANVNSGATPGAAVTDEEKIKQQLDQEKNKPPPLAAELSDSTRDDLMQQLGGRKNMDYEGVHQADKLAKEMAKQSDHWGHV